MTRKFPEESGGLSSSSNFSVYAMHNEKVGSVTLHPVVNKHREAKKVFLEF